MSNTQTGRMTNKEMAEVLFNIGTILRIQGNTNPFRTAAYERGARALMGLGRPVTEILAVEEKVPFRRRQHIGKKLQAKIREMAQSHLLAQYGAMVAELPPHIASLLALPGMGPRMAERIHTTLGIGTAADLIRAARDGRLRQVRGFGPRRIAALASLSLPDETPEREWPQPRLFDLPRAA